MPANPVTRTKFAKMLMTEAIKMISSARNIKYVEINQNKGSTRPKVEKELYYLSEY